eukprot:g20916.t1
MDQLQVAEALMGRGGDLDYASSSKWGGQLTGLAAVLIDYLASLGSSSREEGKSALAIARSLQPCDPILQLGCWDGNLGPSQTGSHLFQVMPRPDMSGHHGLGRTSPVVGCALSDGS